MNKHRLGVVFSSLGAVVALCGTLIHLSETGLVIAGGCLAFFLNVVLSVVHLSRLRKGYERHSVPIGSEPGLVYCERDTETR